jgi:hypothetical protein
MQPPRMGPSPMRMGGRQPGPIGEAVLVGVRMLALWPDHRRESDEYYGDDMHLVHLKGRGSTW